MSCDLNYSGMFFFLFLENPLKCLLSSLYSVVYLLELLS